MKAMFLARRPKSRNPCRRRRTRLRLFFISLSFSLHWSIEAIYFHSRIRSKHDRNVIALRQTERLFRLRNANKERFYLISSALSMLGLCRARDFSIPTFTNFGSKCSKSQAFKKVVVKIKVQIFPRVLPNKFNKLCCWLLYFLQKYLNKWFIVQNLKIAKKKLISKLFVRHSSGDKRRNEGKNSIDFLVKLNEDDWVFEKSVTTRDQRKSFKL